MGSCISRAAREGRNDKNPSGFPEGFSSAITDTCRRAPEGRSSATHPQNTMLLCLCQGVVDNFRTVKRVEPQPIPARQGRAEGRDFPLADEISHALPGRPQRGRRGGEAAGRSHQRAQRHQTAHQAKRIGGGRSHRKTPRGATSRRPGRSRRAGATTPAQERRPEGAGAPTTTGQEREQGGARSQRTRGGGHRTHRRDRPERGETEEADEGGAPPEGQRPGAGQKEGRRPRAAPSAANHGGHSDPKHGTAPPRPTKRRRSRARAQRGYPQSVVRAPPCMPPRLPLWQRAVAARSLLNAAVPLLDTWTLFRHSVLDGHGTMSFQKVGIGDFAQWNPLPVPRRGMGDHSPELRIMA